MVVPRFMPRVYFHSVDVSMLLFFLCYVVLNLFHFYCSDLLVAPCMYVQGVLDDQGCSGRARSMVWISASFQ